jgi:hypothetical protein
MNAPRRYAQPRTHLGGHPRVSDNKLAATRFPREGVRETALDNDLADTSDPVRTVMRNAASANRVQFLVASRPVTQRINKRCVSLSRTHAGCALVVLLVHPRIAMVQQRTSQVGQIAAIQCG